MLDSVEIWEWTMSETDIEERLRRYGDELEAVLERSVTGDAQPPRMGRSGQRLVAAAVLGVVVLAAVTFGVFSLRSSDERVAVGSGRADLDPTATAEERAAVDQCVLEFAPSPERYPISVGALQDPRVAVPFGDVSLADAAPVVLRGESGFVTAVLEGREVTFACWWPSGEGSADSAGWGLGLSPLDADAVAVFAWGGSSDRPSGPVDLVVTAKVGDDIAQVSLVDGDLLHPLVIAGSWAAIRVEVDQVHDELGQIELEWRTFAGAVRRETLEDLASVRGRVCYGEAGCVRDVIDETVRSAAGDPSKASQVEALEDGAVTDEEYADTRDSLIDCIRSARLPIEGSGDQTAAVVTDPADLEMAIQCWDRHASAVVAVHDLEQIAARLEES